MPWLKWYLAEYDLVVQSEVDYITAFHYLMETDSLKSWASLSISGLILVTPGSPPR